MRKPLGRASPFRRYVKGTQHHEYTPSFHRSCHGRCLCIVRLRKSRTRKHQRTHIAAPFNSHGWPCSQKLGFVFLAQVFERLGRVPVQTLGPAHWGRVDNPILDDIRARVHRMNNVVLQPTVRMQVWASARRKVVKLLACKASAMNGLRDQSPGSLMAPSRPSPEGPGFRVHRNGGPPRGPATAPNP